jgi:ketosteroid isomerase-like protein
MTARTDDCDEIVRVMRFYIDAFNDNDVSKLKEAFDKDAWIFYVDADGTLHKNLISERFEKWASPPSWGVVGRFITVTQVGDAASVQLSFDSDGESWIDFHNLLRISGVWKITTRPPLTAAGSST